MNRAGLSNYEASVAFAIDHKVEQVNGRHLVLADRKFIDRARAAHVHPTATAGEVLRRAGYKLKQGGKRVFVIGRANA